MNAIEQGKVQGGRTDAGSGSYHHDGASEQRGGWSDPSQADTVLEESYYGEVRRLDRGVQHADGQFGAQADPGGRQGGSR